MPAAKLFIGYIVLVNIIYLSLKSTLMECPHLQHQRKGQKPFRGNFLPKPCTKALALCSRLKFLQSNNQMGLLRGGDNGMPESLLRLTGIKSLDIFNNNNNNSTTGVHRFQQASEQVRKSAISPAPGTSPASPEKAPKGQRGGTTDILMVLLLATFFLLFILVLKRKGTSRRTEKKIVENFQDSPVELVVVEDRGNLDVEKALAIVFFGEENERFYIDDLLRSEAELQGQNFYSSLYKVTLNSNAVFAVKRLRKLQDSIEKFKSTMTWIGKLKHPNLLPLVACHASEDEQLLVYRFQAGNLSNLLSSYAGGSRVFPWKLRISIAHGIAKGLQYIAKESRNRNMPHGNLKPSNILLNDLEEPQISEYGVQSVIDPKWEMMYSYNGYKAPEKNLTEKADIFSFGVILLELLTGRAVENSSIDLPKWVKAKIREEWTGEVFDSEINRAAGHWAFPLLNIALQCVSHVPEQRPTISDILEKIENMIKEQDDCSFSSTSSVESSKQDYQPNYRSW